MELKVSEAPNRWLNNEEAAKYLGCKKTFLQYLRVSGKIRFYKVRGLILYIKCRKTHKSLACGM